MVISYNRFASESDTQLQQSSIFGEELASILYRQTVKIKSWFTELVIEKS